MVIRLRPQALFLRLAGGRLGLQRDDRRPGIAVLVVAQRHGVEPERPRGGLRIVALFIAGNPNAALLRRETHFGIRTRIVLMWCGSVPVAFYLAMTAPDAITALPRMWVALSLFEAAIGIVLFLRAYRETSKSTNLNSL